MSLNLKILIICKYHLYCVNIIICTNMSWIFLSVRFDKSGSFNTAKF